MNKRIWSRPMILLLMALCLLSGCGPQSQTADSQPVLPEERIDIIISHNQPVDSPEDLGAKAMQERLEALLGERVSVELYPAAQKGTLSEQIEATQLGEIHLTMQPISAVTPYVDDIKVLDLPYLMPADAEAVRAVLDGPMGQEALERLEAGGFHGLGFWFEGYKLFTTRDTPVHSPADLQGMTMRIIESPLLRSQYEYWGAMPVAIDYTELYQALQDGTVDGQENPLQTIVLNNLHQVQGEIIQSYHGTMTYLLLASGQWFDQLPEDVQQAIVEAEVYGRQVAWEAYQKQEQAYLDILQHAEGVHYYELTPEEQQMFQVSVQGLYQQQLAGNVWQQDYVKRLQQALGR